MRLPNENRSDIATTNKLPEFNIEDKYGRVRQKYLKDDDTLPKNYKSQRGQADFGKSENIVAPKNYKESAVDTIVTAKYNNRGQGRKLAQQSPTPAQPADETDIEHETDFSIPK